MNVLITGGSRGIGFGIAEQLVAAGHRLMIVSKSEARIRAAADVLNREKSGRTQFFVCDVSDKASIEALFAECERLLFRVDCVVVNAGIFIEGSLTAAPENDFDATLSVNFRSALHLVQAFLPQLQQSDFPRVILVGSTAAYEAYPVGPLYGVAKWALRGLAVNLRRELMPLGIGVTFLAPGGTLTDLWSGEELPPARLLEPADIGKLVAVMLCLSRQACVEELVIRPMLGDMHE